MFKSPSAVSIKETDGTGFDFTSSFQEHFDKVDLYFSRNSSASNGESIFGSKRQEGALGSWGKISKSSEISPELIELRRIPT